jgi:hypothetical protein
MGRIIKKLSMKKTFTVLILLLLLLFNYTLLKSQGNINASGFCLTDLKNINSSNTYPITHGLIVEDLNGDNYKDIIYAVDNTFNTSYNDQIVCYKNTIYSNGYSTTNFVLNLFTNLGNLTHKFKPENSITSAELIGGSNGYPELLLMDDKKIRILKNNSSIGGTIDFVLYDSLNLITAGSPFGGKNFLEVLDFDGDNKLDILAIGTKVGANEVAFIQYFKGVGTGSFVPFGSQTVVLSPYKSIDLFTDFKYQILDYNGDNLPDLLMNTNSPGKTNSLLYLKSIPVPGTFSVTPISLAIPNTTTSVQITDFKIEDLDNDTRKDIILNLYTAASSYTTLISLNTNTVSGGLPTYNLAQGSLILFDKTFDLVDLNKDGKKELICKQGNTFSAYKGSLVNLNTIFDLLSSNLNWVHPNNLRSTYTIADLDENSFPDIVIANPRNEGVQLDYILNFSYDNLLVPPTLNLSTCTNIVVKDSMSHLKGLSALLNTWTKFTSLSSTVFAAPFSYTIIPNATTHYYQASTTSSLLVNNQFCTYKTPTYTVNLDPTPIVTNITSNNPLLLCENDTEIYTFNSANSYVFNPPNGSGNSYTYTPFSSGIFTITATNALGCKKDSVIDLSPIPSPSLSIFSSVPSLSICSSASVMLTAAGTYSTLTWINDGSTNTQLVVTPSTTTTYTIEASFLPGICSNKQTITISVFPDLTNPITSSTNKVCVGDSVKLSGTGAFGFDWLNYGTANDPSNIFVKPSTPTTYSVNIKDFTTNCVYSKTIFIDIDENCKVNIVSGTGITPNNDSSNDTWIIDNIDKYPSNVVSLYNRYGIEI